MKKEKTIICLWGSEDKQTKNRPLTPIVVLTDIAVSVMLLVSEQWAQLLEKKVLNWIENQICLKLYSILPIAAVVAPKTREGDSVVITEDVGRNHASIELVKINS